MELQESIESAKGGTADQAVHWRNVRHARVAAAWLMTMREAGRDLPSPDDMSALYTALAVDDALATGVRTPLHPAFAARSETSAASIAAERAAHAEPSVVDMSLLSNAVAGDNGQLDALSVAKAARESDHGGY